MSSSLVLGIDLGNTCGSVAVLRNATLDVVPNEQGSRVTPSVISFTEVETLLGEAARGQAARNAANTIVDGLQLLGREFDDAAFQEEAGKWRFHTSKAKDGKSVQVDVHVKGEAKSIATPRVLSHLHSVQRYPPQRLHLDVLSFWKHISSSLPFSPPPPPRSLLRSFCRCQRRYGSHARKDPRRFHPASVERSDCVAAK